MKNLNIRIGREYAIKLHNEGQDAGVVPYYEKWTPMIDRTLRDDFLSVYRKEELKNGSKFCDCIIEKLKVIYPDSLIVPVPQVIFNKVAIDCMEIVARD